MRVFWQELKKVFRPGRCLMALAVLLVLCRNVPQSQSAAMKIMHTEDYPEEYLQGQGYEIRMEFSDHLLEIYGSVITREDLADIQAREEQLEAQLIEAAAENDFLKEAGVFYEPGIGFMGTKSETHSKEKTRYLNSVVDGQVQLDGMDHPIFFLYGYQGVRSTLEQDGIYHVLGRAPLDLGWNLNIVRRFIFAGLLLILLYGVSEKRSKTESMAYSTGEGRRIYRKKLLACTIAGIGITLLGVVTAYWLFSRWGLQRYYGSIIDTVLTAEKAYQTADGEYHRQYLDYGITYLRFYRILLGILAAGGIPLFPLAAVICLRQRSAITAAAQCLPIYIWLYIFSTRYIICGFGLEGPVSKFRFEPFVIVGIWAVIAAIVTICCCIQKQRGEQ